MAPGIFQHTLSLVHPSHCCLFLNYCNTLLILAPVECSPHRSQKDLIKTYIRPCHSSRIPSCLRNKHNLAPSNLSHMSSSILLLFTFSQQPWLTSWSSSTHRVSFSPRSCMAADSHHSNHCSHVTSSEISFLTTLLKTSILIPAQTPFPDAALFSIIAPLELPIYFLIYTVFAHETVNSTRAWALFSQTQKTVPST